MHVRRFAGVIAIHQERIVLVRERHDRWGGDFWSIPSGMVESHETPVRGAVRELVEETGLVTTPDDLHLIGTSATTAGQGTSLAWNFTAFVDNPVISVNDPDGSILGAHWFTRGEAIARLRLLPYRPLAEPVLAYLEDTVEAGAHWRYDAAVAEPVVTASMGSGTTHHME